MQPFDHKRGALRGLGGDNAFGTAVELQMPGNFPEVTGDPRKEKS
jgi:hypothetical protein